MDQDGISQKRSLRDSPSTVVVIIVVMVVLILLFSTIFSYTLWPPDDEELPPETIEDGVTVINGDVVWEQRHGLLDMRVEVREGGSLRLENCSLRIPIEDLAASSSSWFNVQGELTIENTTIEIWKDPRLEGALSFESRPGSSGSATLPPYIYRAVNLEDSVEPVLAFDTRVWGEGGDLIVAYQTDPGEELQVLSELVMAPDPESIWQHHEVSLSDLRGSIVNLFIIGLDPDLGRYLLGDLKVTDGGGDLPRDIHFTGFPERDRWGYVHAQEALSRLRRDPWGNLIWCSGVLTILHSELTAPRDINHTYSSPIHGDIKFNAYDPDAVPELYYKMKDGGDIEGYQANIIIVNTVLEHVLVRAHDCELLIRDVEVTGDRELVTAYHCSGTIEGTTFRGQDDSWDTTHRWYDGPRFWGLAVWYQGDGGVMNVTDCTFQDTPLAIDLTHTAASVEGCTFINCSFLAIWDHNSTGLEDWEALNASCDFSTAKGRWYYRSHNGRFNLTSPTTPDDWFDGDYDTDGDIEGSDAGWTLYGEDFWVFRAWGRLYVPTFSVDRKGVAETINEVYVLIESNWGGGTLATLDTSLSHFMIELPGNGTGPPPSSPTYVYLNIMDEELKGNGVLGLQVEASFNFDNKEFKEYMAPDGLVVHQRIDGELVDTYPLTEYSGGYNFIEFTLNTSVDVGPGVSRVDFTLEGVQWGSEEVQELAWSNRTYLRPSDPEDLAPMLEQFTEDYPVVLIDEGLDIELDISTITLELFGYNMAGLTLLMGEGSSIALGDATDIDQIGFYLESEGFGDITIRDIDTYECAFQLTNTTLTVEDSVLGSITGILEQSDCLFKNVTIGPQMWWWTTECNLTIEDSDIMVDWCLLVPFFSNLSFINCTVTGERERHWLLESGVNDTLVFAGCTFDGTRLDLGTTAYAYTLIEFSDCEFGNGSVLEAPRHSPQFYLDGLLPDDPAFTVSNTSFIGEGSGFIGHTNIFRAAVEGMETTDGASYRVYIDTRVIVPIKTADGYQYRAELFPIVVPGLADWELHWVDDLLHVRSLHVLDSEDDLDWDLTIDVALTGDDFSYGSDPIVWFYSIDLLAPEITITLPDWGDHVDLMNVLMQDIDVYRWWSGD